jgi:hypothetical protein
MSRRKWRCMGMMAALVCGLGSAAQAAIIYQDSFTGSGALNGATPTTTTGGATWVAAGGMDMDGSGTLSFNGERNAYLPFTPVAGYVYTLTATLDNTASRAAFGFATVNFGTPTTSGHWHTINGASPWVASGVSGGDGIYFLTGPGWSGDTTVASPAPAGAPTMSIVLDTQTDENNWSATFWLGNTQLGAAKTFSAASWTRNAVGFGSMGGSSESGFQAMDFELSVIPEPATFGVMLSALAAVVLRRRRMG